MRLSRRILSTVAWLMFAVASVAGAQNEIDFYAYRYEEGPGEFSYAVELEVSLEFEAEELLLDHPTFDAPVSLDLNPASGRFDVYAEDFTLEELNELLDNVGSTVHFTLGITTATSAGVYQFTTQGGFDGSEFPPLPTIQSIDTHSNPSRPTFHWTGGDPAADALGFSLEDLFGSEFIDGPLPASTPSPYEFGLDVTAGTYEAGMAYFYILGFTPLIHVGGNDLFGGAPPDARLALGGADTEFVTIGPFFIRGDANGDQSFTGLVDGVFMLAHQFVPGSPAPPCREAADADGDNSFSGLVDGIYALSFQFVPGAPPIPAPFPECGPDNDAISNLGCEVSCF